MKQFAAAYDEGVAWGRVCVEGTRIPVGELADRFAAGESLASIAADMLITEADLESVLRLFLVALPGRHGLKVESKMRELLS